MSTVRADTLTNLGATKSVPVTTVVDGSAKAWVVFNQVGAQAIRRAFNVSSITDGGVGITLINFATPLPTDQYVVACGARDTTTGGEFLAERIGGARSTTQLTVDSWNYTGTRLDGDFRSVAIFA